MTPAHDETLCLVVNGIGSSAGSVEKLTSYITVNMLTGVCRIGQDQGRPTLSTFGGAIYFNPVAGFQT